MAVCWRETALLKQVQSTNSDQKWQFAGAKPPY